MAPQTDGHLLVKREERDPPPRHTCITPRSHAPTPSATARRHHRPPAPRLPHSLLPNAPGSARKTFHAAQVSNHAHTARGRGFAYHRLRTPNAPWPFPALNQPGRTPHSMECSTRRHVACRPAPTVAGVPAALHYSPDAKARSETWNHRLGASQWAQRHLVGRKI